MADSTPARVVLCRLDELEDPGSRGVTVTEDGQLHEVFVVRLGKQVFAYLNSCPHTGGPLDWVPDQFLNIDKDHIQCATHAALFQLQDGVCIAGPCKGEHLTAVPVCLDAGEVVLLARVP